ncbi:MAG: carboxypeptidase-like regulatory domain-containing protein [Mucilaginibacter sp.]
MSNQTDISQLIRKYLKGELDARAMHSFEREAQGDPFVMDALDGYTKAGTDQQANLAEIGSRLDKLIRPAGTGFFNWKFLSIVTSVAILLTAGVFVISDQPEKKEQKLALKEKTNIVQPAPELSNVNKDTAAETTVNELNPVLQPPATTQVIVPNKSIVTDKKISAPVKGTVTVSTAAQQKPTDSTSLEEMIALNYKPAEQGQNKISPTSASAGGAGNLSTGTAALAASENAKKENVSASDVKASNVISGRIMDAAGPIPGARVTVKGTTISIVTDLNGRFTLPAAHKRAVLDVSMAGYTGKQVKVNQKDSLFIDMKPKQAITGVITGYGRAPCCWDVYEKYLKDNAISPDGKAGTVKLSFVVNPDNSLTDFNISKGLSEKTDQKAIDLIKNGPVWLHDSSGKPTKVNLRIKFAAKQ